MQRRSSRKDYGDLAITVPLLNEWASQNGLAHMMPKDCAFERSFVGGASFDKRRIIFARVNVDHAGDRIVAFLEALVGEFPCSHEPIAPTGKKNAVELMVRAVEDMRALRRLAEEAAASPKRRARARRRSPVALCGMA